ncbi:PRD domain-containing protein, partial [Bacillus altitudinis]|uniref:PRD domain-containing protein n=1 Tax=Bacillus altitudinis TaxID=293387 RepID=UPI003B52EABB
MLQYPQKPLNSTLNSPLYFTFIHHFNFPLQPHNNNINITNPLYSQIKNYYTQQF